MNLDSYLFPEQFLVTHQASTHPVPRRKARKIESLNSGTKKIVTKVKNCLTLIFIIQGLFHDDQLHHLRDRSGHVRNDHVHGRHLRGEGELAGRSSGKEK